MDAMKNAIQVSNHISFQKPNYEPLTLEDAFYLATLGGAAGEYQTNLKTIKITTPNSRNDLIYIIILFSFSSVLGRPNWQLRTNQTIRRINYRCQCFASGSPARLYSKGPTFAIHLQWRRP